MTSIREKKNQGKYRLFMQSKCLYRILSFYEKIWWNSFFYTSLFKNRPSSLQERKDIEHLWNYEIIAIQLSSYEQYNQNIFHIDGLKNLKQQSSFIISITWNETWSVSKRFKPPSIDHSVIHLFKTVQHWNIDITGYWLITAGC